MCQSNLLFSVRNALKYKWRSIPRKIVKIQKHFHYTLEEKEIHKSPKFIRKLIWDPTLNKKRAGFILQRKKVLREMI